MTSYNTLTIEQLAPLVASRRVSSAELVEACLAEIERRDPELNAFITVTGDSARRDAAKRDEELAGGHGRGALHGIPMSIKDLIDVAGQPTTAASRVRSGHIASADAPLVTALKRAGAVIIGKCNLHEFAYGTTSDDSAFGPVRNPHDPTRSPGGSSGGSAAAVATGMCMASIGTDTGGSIRIPAAACGTVGLKPTYGEVPCEGVVPLSQTLDHVGPLARSVADARLIWEVIAVTADAQIETSSHRRLGLPRAYFFETLDEEIRARFDEVVARLQGSGLVIDEVSIPHARDISPVYDHIVCTEAAAYHAPMLDARPHDYTERVRERLEVARYVLAEDYARALKGREVLRHEVAEVLDERDALILPTLPIQAPPIGATTVQVGAGRQAVRSMLLRMTQLFNLTGHPAITIPIGVTSDRLPVGLQIVGHRGATRRLLATAALIEATLQT